MRFESVTIAAGEKARCKSRPRMNRRDCVWRARLNGNTFSAVSLPSAAARRCADHASSAARFSSAQSCLW